MTYIFLTHFTHYIFIIFIASCFPYFNLSMMQKIIFYIYHVNNLSVQYQYDIHSSCFEYFFKTNSTFSIFLSFFPFHQKIFPFLSPLSLIIIPKELEIYYTFVLTEIVTRNSSPKNDSKWKFHSVVRWLKKKKWVTFYPRICILMYTVTNFCTVVLVSRSPEASLCRGDQEVPISRHPGCHYALFTGW